MTSHKKTLKRKEIEHLENTSIAIFGLMDDGNSDACQYYNTCGCTVTGVQCCNTSSTCISAVTFAVCDEPTTGNYAN